MSGLTSWRSPIINNYKKCIMNKNYNKDEGKGPVNKDDNMKTETKKCPECAGTMNKKGDKWVCGNCAHEMDV